VGETKISFAGFEAPLESTSVTVAPPNWLCGLGTETVSTEKSAPNSVTIASGATACSVYEAAFTTLSGDNALEVLLAKFASPVYTAASDRAGDGAGAIPLPPESTADAASTPVIVSRNFTVPVGTPAPGATAATVVRSVDPDS